MDMDMVLNPSGPTGYNKGQELDIRRRSKIREITFFERTIILKFVLKRLSCVSRVRLVRRNGI